MCGPLFETYQSPTDSPDEAEIKIRRQREILRETAGCWKSEDHPELAKGAAAWVEEIRALDNGRFEELELRREDK